MGKSRHLALSTVAALAGLGLTTSAHAGSVTLGNITLTQVISASPGTFDNNPVGAYTGVSSAVYDGVVGPISFAAGADTTGVTNGTYSYAAAPNHEATNYLWGLNDGTTVTFTNGPAASFLDIWWGSIDAVAQANRYDNILTLNLIGGGIDALTGSDLVNAGAVLGSIDGQGTQTGLPDNQWFLVSDTNPFMSFTVTSSQNAFEFDMAAPEPSTWAMMVMGFAGLGYAAFRRARKESVSAFA